MGCCPDDWLGSLLSVPSNYVICDLPTLETRLHLLRIRRPLSSLYQTCLVRRPPLRRAPLRRAPLRRAPLRRPPLPPSPTVSGFSRGEEEEEGEICLAAQNMFKVTSLDPNYLVKLDPRTILKAALTLFVTS